MKYSIVIALALILAGASFAAGSCAANAYNQACSSCSFDASGKMDAACYGGFKASGTTCTSVSYPIMAAKYAKGDCPAVDACASQLSACTAQYSSGNDSADCKEGSLAVCFAAADSCTSHAATQCGEIEKQCPGTSAGFVLLAGFLGYGKLSGMF